MNIRIIIVGKRLGSELQAVADSYQKRLSPHANLDWHMLVPSRLPDEAARNDESTRILAALKPNDIVILLDERGELMSNEAFADTYQTLASQHGQLVIVIGGAYGVSDELRQRAQLVWSLSPLVFPHELVRVILLEQLYRTYMVLQSHPYHHS